MGKKTFVYGTLILFGANLINRMLAFVYQYLVMTWVGAEAYGIYQMVFPTYIMALVLTTAGLPLAISKLVSEQTALGNTAAARKIFHTALVILLCSGMAVSIALYLLLPRFAGPLFPDKRVLPVFTICIPAIFFVAACSAFRGYFQGLQEMQQTAVEQICEQITRIIVALTLATRLLPLGIEYGAVGLAAGMVCGELVGLGVMLFLYRRHKKRYLIPDQHKTPGIPAIIKNLFRLGIPVSAGRLITSAASTADSILIPQRLEVAGYSIREAATLYGQLGGAAVVLLTFPTVFTSSLSTSLVPAVSEALAAEKLPLIRRRTGEAIRYTILVGAPFLVFLNFFAPELTDLFKSPNAAAVLTTLTFGGLFLYLQGTTAGVLQGLGQPQIPVFHTIIASCFKLIVLYHLTAIPSLGLVGAAWSYNVAYTIISLLNLLAINRRVGLTLELERVLLQPLSAATLMGGALYLAKSQLAFLPALQLLPLAFLLSAAVYLATLFANGGLSRTDLRRIPLIGRFITF